MFVRQLHKLGADTAGHVDEHNSRYCARVSLDHICTSTDLHFAGQWAGRLARSKQHESVISGSRMTELGSELSMIIVVYASWHMPSRGKWGELGWPNIAVGLLTFAWMWRSQPQPHREWQRRVAQARRNGDWNKKIIHGLIHKVE